MYNEYDSLTSWHKITLDGLICHLTKKKKKKKKNVLFLISHQAFLNFFTLIESLK